MGWTMACFSSLALAMLFFAAFVLDADSLAGGNEFCENDFKVVVGSEGNKEFAMFSLCDGCSIKCTVAPLLNVIFGDFVMFTFCWLLLKCAWDTWALEGTETAMAEEHGEPTAPAGDGTVVGLEVKPYPVHDAEPAHPDSLQLHADSLPAQADSSPAYAASSPAGALSPRERAGTGAQPLGGPQGGARGHSSSTISNNDFDTKSPFE